MDDRARLDHATAAFDPPFAAVDLDAFDANAADMERRANGTPIRLASKSVRCRALIDRALARDGFRSIMAFTLPELPYAHDALKPYMSAETLEFHHDKHRSRPELGA